MTPNHPHQIPIAGISEARLLALVSAVQFVNILDFMLVMPLGPDFARDLHIPLSQLGWIGGAYTGAASVSGLVAAKFLDRFDRRSALAATLLGLVIGTACGGIAFDLPSLLLARVLAGVFGGPASALSLSIIADVVPSARRGKALGVVGGAFSIATVLGLPAALELARLGGWRSAFFSVAGLGSLVAAAAVFAMPSLRLHLAAVRDAQAPRFSLLADKAGLLALVATFTAMVAAFSIAPNISSYVQANLGYPRDQLGTLYLVGGACSFVVMRATGRLADRFGATFTVTVGTFVFVGLLATAFVAEWRMPATVIYLLFMAGMSIRNISVSTLSTRVPLAHERARFMSLQSAVQHAAAALGAVMSAHLLSERPDHTLAGMPHVAGVAIALSLCLPGFFFAIERLLRARDTAAERVALAPEPAFVEQVSGDVHAP